VRLQSKGDCVRAGLQLPAERCRAWRGNAPIGWKRPERGCLAILSVLCIARPPQGLGGMDALALMVAGSFWVVITAASGVISISLARIR